MNTLTTASENPSLSAQNHLCLVVTTQPNGATQTNLGCIWIFWGSSSDWEVPDRQSLLSLGLERVSIPKKSWTSHRYRPPVYSEGISSTITFHITPDRLMYWTSAPKKIWVHPHVMPDIDSLRHVKTPRQLSSCFSRQIREDNRSPRAAVSFLVHRYESNEICDGGERIPRQNQSKGG